MSNPKGELQELCQKRGFPLPEYSYVEGGPSSQSRFAPRLVLGLSPFVMSVTVQWEGETLTELGSGHNKKDAQKEAATLMLQRIRGGNGGGMQPCCGGVASQAKGNSTVFISKSHTVSPSNCPVEGLGVDELDPYSEPTPSPSRFKSELQEFLQKDLKTLKLPTYELVSSRGPAHKKEFTVKCVVSLRGDEIECTGVGSTKKVAESLAAKNMLQRLQASDIPDHEEIFVVPRGLPQRDVPSLLMELAAYDVRFEEFEGDSKMHLCLAWASGGRGLDTSIAAHGYSTESKELAKAQALSNLKDSIHQLS